jgi:dipeptidyl aminopeptidase/acylaminoacyl peptidase
MFRFARRPLAPVSAVAPALAPALVVSLVLAAGVAMAADTWTPHHVARVRTVTSVRIAPDGSAIAYTLSVPRQPLVDEDGGPWQELHLLAPDGVSRPFVTGEVNVAGVEWMPDGKTLSFLARRGKDTTRSLYAMRVDGGEPRRLLGFDTDIASYAWSPDGESVAFLARAAADKTQRDLERKGFNQEIYEESVPPTRVWIATIGSEAAPRLLDLAGSASTVAWSPSGDRLTVALAPTPLVDDDYMKRLVHVVDAATGGSVGNLGNAGKLGEVAWSPDAKHIALLSGADVNDPAVGRLLVAPAGGGTLKDLIPGYAGHVAAFAWKDANTIMFVGDEGTETVVGEVTLAGVRRTIVPAGGSILGSIDLAGNGSVAFIGHTARHPGEVFLQARGDREPRRLTDSNPWLKDMRFAPQEAVTFKARDGLELQGVLVRPLDEKPGQRYPLILTVHGGPEAHDRNGWTTGYANAGQVGAARGFAVFYPNYRGSTGRGVEFSKLGQRDAAGKEFDDLVDAVDHMVRTGLVDGAKVGITGGSYGGYASAWGATYYSDRFAAAVMFVGISNLVSKVGTTDIPNEEELVHARSRPWDDWSDTLKRSPIMFAGRSKTPTLILGGTDDPRVHPSQSLEMYRHLKLRGKAPVRLVRYPGEQHGNRRAASRLDYNLRLMQWMEHYLKGPGGAPPPYEVDYAAAKAATPATTSPAVT